MLRRRRAVCASIAVSVVSTLAVAAAGAPPAAAAEAPVVIRVTGDDVTGASVVSSQAWFKGWNSRLDQTDRPRAGTAIVASAIGFADALVGTPLAARYTAPLLLTSGPALDRRVLLEIQRILEPGQVVTILGGPAAVPAGVDDHLRALGYGVARYGGADRFETAALVAHNGLGTPSTVLQASGLDAADALVAGVAAARVRGAVLLTNGAVQHPVTDAYVRAHSLVRYAIGGDAADAARRQGTVTRIVGDDRFATARLVADRFTLVRRSLVIANGFAPSDVLLAGSVAAVSGGTLLLTARESLPTPTREWARAARATLASAVVFGDLETVHRAVLETLAADIGATGPGVTLA